MALQDFCNAEFQVPDITPLPVCYTKELSARLQCKEHEQKKLEFLRKTFQLLLKLQ